MDYRLIAPTVPRNELSAVERVLTNRGIELSEIQHYLHPTDQDILDPARISNMDAGLKMLIKHISQNDKVLIQVDSDCDGFTSSALLINYLNCLFPGFVQNNISYRIHTGKQHGIIVDTVPNDVKLVIAPDSSSNDYEQHELLSARGVDVLVIDHHEADHVSKYACVINNQLCDYPTKSLSGVGMVYKFCSYIDQFTGTNYAEQFLDLVALGMVGDMMDLRDIETRHLVVKGIQSLRNPYFKEMVKTQEYSLNKVGGLSPFGISFYIAPMVNATIRVGTDAEKLMLFESMLDYRGYELIPSTKRGCKGQVEMRIEQACRNCKNIKNRQTKTRDASLEIIKRIIEEQNLLSHKILVICLENPVDTNLTGLIANELASEYARPTLILNKRVSEDGAITWEGSGRNCGNSKLENLREFLNSTGLVMYAEGHASAFGAGIADEDLANFKERTDELLKDFDFSPCYRVDFIWDDRNFNTNDVLKIAELKPIWGQGVEEPLIAIENIKVHAGSVQLMSPDKSPTLKITLPNGMSLIKFGSSNEEYEKLNSDLGCVTINIVGKCERNIWNGNINPQMIIEDYEIVGQTDYYF